MFISICIPTYNEPGKIKKLLESILIQTYKDYEVIITDDSSNELTKNLVANEFAELPVTFVKNEIPLGTPENWNYSISLARGEWVKLMHHDDWFYDAQSLQLFSQYAKSVNQRQGFIFCAYQNVRLNSDEKEKVVAGRLGRLILTKWPLILFKKNIIGNPSCTMIKRELSASIVFDNKLKWIVDFEYYIRLLYTNSNIVFIKKVLVNIGIHDQQVTKFSQLNPEIEIPEAIYFISCHGTKTLKNIFVYDYYWRLMRNLNIRSVTQFNNYLDKSCQYKPILDIINRQSKINPATLKIGVISKLLMSVSFLSNLMKN